MLNALVAGHTKDFVSIIEDVLLDLNYEVYTAGNEFETRQIIDEYPIDLAVFEDTVPAKDGVIAGAELCRSLKSGDNNNRTLIILASEESSRSANSRKALASGAAAFFTKDNIAFDLRSFLKNVLSMAKLIGYGKNPAVLVESDNFQRSQIKSLLSFAGIKIYEFASGTEALDYMNKYKPEVDIFIIDYLLKDTSCGSVLQYIKSIPAYQQIPVMVTTEYDDQNKKYELFLLGASDFISKPFDTGEFYLRLQNHLKTKHLLDMLEAKNKILTINATTDELTGLFNRRFFWECLKKESNRSERLNSHFSVIIMDIDDFKYVNDVYGHLNGDKVLSTISSILKKEIRKSDTIGRFGGEEFIVLLPDTELENAGSVAEKLREKISNINFDFMSRNVTLSLGVANSYEGGSFEKTISIADERLYKAKEKGKNMVFCT